MTKIEAKEQGAATGKAAGELAAETVLREEDHVTRANLVVEAAMSAAGRIPRMQQVAYETAYTENFMAAKRRRLNELPDIKAARRVDSLSFHLDYMLRTAADELAKFQARFAESPLYAFEWADGAIQAAAQQDVALRIRSVLTGVNVDGTVVPPDVAAAYCGFDKAIAMARDEALRGARWPSHSTSAASNIAAQYKTATYADLVAEMDDTRGR